MTPPQRITAADILRAAGTVNDESEKPVAGSTLIDEVVDPALAKAENAALGLALDEATAVFRAAWERPLSREKADEKCST
jgi:hypothetical protein